MKKLLIVVLALGALYYFKPEWFPFGASDGAFDAEGNPEALIFTAQNCGGWCKKGLTELKRRNVPYRELKLDNSEENQQLYYDLGRGGLPYVVIGKHKISGFRPAAMASALAQAYGDEHLNHFEEKYYAKHFNNDGSPRVYMYGASWCPHCKAMRQELNERGIDFGEIDVEKAHDRAKLEKTMQIGGYPVMYVGYIRVNPPEIGNVLDALDTADNRKM